MKWLKRLIIGLLCLLIIGWVAGLIFAAQGIGMTGLDENGRLSPCPDKPNCVSSQSAGKYPQGDPFSVGSHATPIADLAAIINDMPRITIVSQTDTYLHVEFRTQLMRFVDDVEFLADETSGVVHYRSASRSGYSDLNVNAKRIKTIRAAFK